MYDLAGYVLESVRVGQSNSPLTYSPDVLVLDPVAFSSFFDGNETEPETSYCCLVVSGGDLPDARFAWVRNDQTTRFEYRDGAFKPVAMGLLGSHSQAYLSPIPQSGEYPLLRLGFGTWVEPVTEVPDEGSFAADPIGAQWALDTGRIKLNSLLQGEVYCDGVVNAFGLFLPRQFIGTVGSPLPILGLPPAGGDVIVRVPTRQFPVTKRVQSFSASIPAGTVEVRDDGQVQFSVVDVAKYGSDPVEVIFGDLPLEHGLAVRFFRSPVNLSGGSERDLTSLYTVEDAVLSSSLVASPIVFLPSTPNQGFQVSARTQAGALYNLSESTPATPGTTLGFIVDFPQRRLVLAKRVNELELYPDSPSVVVLPDGLLQEDPLVERELSEGSNTYQTAETVADLVGGQISLVASVGEEVHSGSGQFVASNTFEDPVGMTAQVGDVLFVNSQVFSVTGTSGNQLTTAEPGAGSGSYEILRGQEVLTEAFFYPLVVQNPDVLVSRTRGLITESIPYRLQAELGVFEIEPLLEGDLVEVSYQSGGIDFQESISFRQRNELAQERTTPSNFVSYNPNARPVDFSKPVVVRRGGRVVKNIVVGPQTVTFTTEVSAGPLPSGDVIEPAERVYVDYWVLSAFGGEKTIQVSHPVDNDLVGAGAGFVKVVVDVTDNVHVGDLLRIGAPGSTSVFEVLSSVFSSGMTTIEIAGSSETLRNPSLEVSRKPTMTTETSAYDPVSVGSLSLTLHEPRPEYSPGTLLRFGLDYYEVQSVVIDNGRTAIALRSPAIKQYTSAVLERSQYPLHRSQFKLRRSPTRTPVLWRKSQGQAGSLVKDATVTPDGEVVLASALAPGESLYAAYVGYDPLPTGARARVSYTAAVSPSAQNGLLGEALFLDYTLTSPDSFFFRVVPASKFSGELLADMSKSLTTTGPPVANASSVPLHEQGQKSIWFDERHVQNSDLVCESVLRYYNDVVNRLEDILQALDGRVVGLADGRIRLNPVVTTYPPTPLTTVPPGPAPKAVQSHRLVTNQIDDLVLVSPYPVESLNPTVFAGTWQKAWEPGLASRFYPTRESVWGTSVAGADTGASPGDVVLDFGVKPLVSSSELQSRTAAARVVRDYAPGSDTFEVDVHDPSGEFSRPGFAVGVAADVVSSTLTVLHGNAVPDLITPTAPTVTIAAVLGSPPRLQLSLPTPVLIPEGSTIKTPELEYLYGGLYTPTGRSYPPEWVSAVDGALQFPGTTTSPPDSGEHIQAQVRYQNQRVTPRRFPAADGMVLDDSQDRSVPFVSPDPFSELGVLEEQTQELPAGDPPLVGFGSLDATKTILTSTPWFGIIPKVYDLLRFTSGANAGGAFRRITAVGPDFVVVDEPMDFAGGGDFIITASSSLASGFGSILGSTLTDLLVSFSVPVGCTVVIESGAAAGDRRQVVSSSATTLTVTPPFSAGGAVTYRVDQSLVTFSGWGPFQDAVADENLVLRFGPLPSGIESVEDSVDAIESLVLTEIGTGFGSVSGSVLIDVNADFSELPVGTILRVPSGPSRGYYVASPTGETTLSVSPPFPVSGSYSYGTYSTLGLGRDSLEVLDRVRDFCERATDYNDSFLSALSQHPVIIPGPTLDPALYANGLTAELLADLDVAAKVVEVNGLISDLEAVLVSERLYDRRWSWVVSRLHLIDGTLPRLAQARLARERAQQQLLNQIVQAASVLP